MKQVTQTQRSGQLRIAEVPSPALHPEGVLVHTAYSLISAGTERAKVEVAKKNLIGKALARPDQVRQVLETARQIGIAATYQKVTSRLDALTPLGYSSAGIAIAVGAKVDGVAPGDWVACAGGGYANHAEIVYVPRNLCVRVPEGVALDEAAFATIGAIALQGVRQATPTLGETIGVIGLGLLGLLTVQLLRATGCRVVGLDINPARCELARTLGADVALTPNDPSVESAVRRLCASGLDAVILTASTSSSEPIRQAGQLARDQGRVVVVGAVGMDIPRSPFYEKELDIRLSRSYGPGRYDPEYEEKGHDYPIGYVRWTEGRNMAAFLDLLAQRKIDVKPLTTHRFPLVEGERAYDVIEGKTNEPYLGVLLAYELPIPADGQVAGVPHPLIQLPQTKTTPKPNGKQGPVALALIGAGNFAQSMLLPHLRQHPKAHLHTVVTTGGLTALSVAERSQFAQCSSDAEAIFADPAIRLALIASRHNSHAALTAQGLKAGKAVFVEKPPALSIAELNQLLLAYQEAMQTQAESPYLMVGFNRRFAPLVAPLYTTMRGTAEPMLLNYRINAGHIPRTHWVQDVEAGGGRIIGEVCHFVDLLIYLVGQPPCEVYARALPDQGRYNRDNLMATLRFTDGSVGSILYAANGDRSLEKERLEVFSGGQSAVLDDFRSLTLGVNGKRTVKKSSPDKGHKDEMNALIETVYNQQPSPIPLEQIIWSMQATFAIQDSILTGQAIEIEVPG